MTKDLQGSSHHLKVVGGAYGKQKDFIYENFQICGFKMVKKKETMPYPICSLIADGIGHGFFFRLYKI